MRTIGLLCLLVGAIILMLPMVNQLMSLRLHLANHEIIGGSLLCLGVAAVALTRREES